MKLEIELDMNKIDYDAINKQIQEKIEGVDISEIVNDTTIDNITTRIINDAYEKYIDKYAYSDKTSYSGKEIVKDVQEEKFKEIVSGIIDDIYAKSNIEEIVSELFPSLFVQAMYDALYNGVNVLATKTANTTINTAVNTTINRIRSSGINVR